MNSNNSYNAEVVVSYDPNKVWKEIKNDEKYFYKKTTLSEVKNLKKMANLLNNAFICIGENNYALKTPIIYDWDRHDEILCLSFCEGENLEFYLRNESTYDKGQLIFNELLKYLIKNKIYWLDFAARNIIIGKNEIYLVDYEKGFAKTNIKIKDFFRDHIYEEYCIFLFQNDRKYEDENILNLVDEKNYTIKIDKIKCKRILKISDLLGYRDSITKKEYLEILNMLIVAQEPQIINGKFYFPCVELDKIFINNSSDKALEIYCKQIIDLYYSKDKH